MGKIHAAVYIPASKLDRRPMAACKKYQCCYRVYLLNISLVGRSVIGSIRGGQCLGFQKFQISLSGRLELSAVQ